MKRKIIEIYLDEDRENNIANFEFNKLDNSEMADELMKSLLILMDNIMQEDDTLEIELDGD